MIEIISLVILILSVAFIYKKKTANRVVQHVQFTNDLKMVMVVRTDLKMGHGKVAAQCCHACLGLYKILLKNDLPRLQAWEGSNYKKVVVKCTTEDDMLSIAASAKAKGLNYYIVRDAGKTQIAPGSKTVLSIGPAMESELKEVTNHLKLL
jgi:PTH2 family peptidyl-tRNA hydrolase